MKVLGLTSAVLLLAAVFGQADGGKNEGSPNALQQANLGRIIFTPKAVPVGSLRETEFLKDFELKERGDLAITAFLGDSLTNYLHRLAPELPVDELRRKGSYQFSFLVDGILI